MKRGFATAFAASLVAAYLLVGLCNLCRPSDAEDARSYDCGVQSLYTLLRLEGVDITLDRLERSLPSPSPRGYSMAELNDAAHACGLRTTPVRLKPDVRAIDRPILAFLRWGEQHGHFIVARPVGHTGELAQILDSGREPDVIDKSALFNSSEWTGLALIPERPNWPARIAAALGLSLISVSLLLWAVPRLRRRAQHA